MQDLSKEHVSKIHMVEHGESSPGQKGNKKRPTKKKKNNKGNKKAKTVFWKCYKLGHKKRNCTIWKRKYGSNNQKVKTKDNFIA